MAQFNPITMNDSLQQDLDDRIRQLNEADQKKLKAHVLQRLIEKLQEDESEEIEQDLRSLIDQFPTSSPVDPKTSRSIRSSVKKIQAKVENTFGYVEKGALKSKNSNTWIAIGVSLGIALGAGMGNPGAGLAIGIGIGVAIGTSVGTKEEKMAEEKGLTY